MYMVSGGLLSSKIIGKGSKERRPQAQNEEFNLEDRLKHLLIFIFPPKQLQKKANKCQNGLQNCF